MFRDAVKQEFGKDEVLAQIKARTPLMALLVEHVSREHYDTTHAHGQK
jgi:hypothetical protein